MALQHSPQETSVLSSVTWVQGGRPIRRAAWILPKGSLGSEVGSEVGPGLLPHPPCSVTYLCFLFPLSGAVSVSASKEQTSSQNKGRRSSTAEEAGSCQPCSEPSAGAPGQRDGVCGPVQLPGHGERRAGLQQGGHTQGRVAGVG